MGLPARQRRILQRTECALQGSDPRLDTLFSIFTRLVQDEDMPGIEQVHARLALLTDRLLGRPARTAARATRWLRAPRRAGVRAALFFPAALGLLAATVVVGLKFPGTSWCPATPRASRAAAQPLGLKTSPKPCLIVVAKPAFIGR